MRHTCEHCSTAYEIPDDKVAGRFLKVRCQKCLGTMHVVGLRALDAAGNDGAMWWAAIGNAPRGPYRRDEITALAVVGDIHAKSRMWRSGMPGWERVCESFELSWVYEEVLAATCESECPDPFARAALLTDGHGYFPDPTLKSGIILLDDDTQRALQTLVAKQTTAKRKLEPIGTRAWPSLLAPTIAAFVGMAAGASGIAWFIASTVGW